MKRKLVALGKNCLMSAIPKKWLKQHKLEKGDFVEFEFAENYLILSAIPLPKEKEISIVIKKDNKVGIMRFLHLLYDSGFKTIKINFEDPKILRSILYSTNILEEWRVTKTSKNECLIKSVESDDFDFHTYFRRIFLCTKEQVNLFSDFLKGNKRVIDEIKTNYELILRGTFNLKRKINTSSLPLEYKYYYYIVVQLQQIADQYEFLFRSLEKNKKSPDILYKFNKKLENLFERAYSSFYKPNIDKFLDLSDLINWKDFETSEFPLQVYYLRNISDKIKSINSYSVGILFKD